MSDPTARLHRPKAEVKEISDFLDDARAGKYELPDFQRGLEWKEEDRIKLFDSIYRGFPIGDILLWEPEEPKRGSNKFGPFIPSTRPETPWLIVDGQQRLSTLFGCLLLRERQPEDPWEDWRFAFDVDSRRIVRLPVNASPELLPLPIAIDTARYLKWTRNLPEERLDERMQSGDDFSKALRNYRIPYYIVRTRDRALLQRVFERLNTTGRSLSGTDVFNALFPTRLNDVTKELESMEFGWVDPEWLLQAVKVMVGMDPAAQFAKQLNSIDEAEEVAQESESMRDMLTAIYPRLVSAAKSAISLLQDSGIRRVEALPYALVLPVLIHFFDKFPNASDEVRASLARFMWQVSAGGTLQHHRSTYLRAVARHIRSAGNAGDAAQALIEYSAVSVRGEDLQSHHDWRSGSTRLVALALFELKPRELESGEIIPVWQLAAEKVDELFRRIWTRGVEEFASTSANRLISMTLGRGGASRHLEKAAATVAAEEASEFQQGDLFGGGTAMGRISPEALRSQAITPEAWAALKAGNRVEFLRLRAAHIGSLVDQFIATRLSGSQ